MSLTPGSHVVGTRKVTPAKPGRGRIPAVPETSVVSVSPTPVEHRTFNLAKAEAERLAQSNPGVEFIVFEVKGTVVSGGTVWK